MKHRTRIHSLLLALTLAAAPTFAAAATYDEAVNGDMSGDPLAPSSLSLRYGEVGTISGTAVAGDLDYITIHVSSTFNHIDLTSFSSTDEIGFIAIQSGTQFTEPPTGTNVANLLGYANFSLPVPTNYLPIMGTAPGAIGIPPVAPPQPGPYSTTWLYAGDYTLWIQQTGPQPVSYTFQVYWFPEPGTFALLALGLGALAALRMRRVT